MKISHSAINTFTLFTVEQLPIKTRSKARAGGSDEGSDWDNSSNGSLPINKPQIIPKKEEKPAPTKPAAKKKVYNY